MANPQDGLSTSNRLSSDVEHRALVQRILGSKEFQRTTRLRDFLLYVSDRKLAAAPQEITEALIGQRVFGRPSTYNPGDDSIVRTEARNLRQRLERYFAGEGAAEPILLEIPKGGYMPVFRPRHAVPEVEVKRAIPRLWLRLVAAAGVLAALAGVWWLVAASANRRETVSAADVVPPPGLVQLESSDPRLVSSFAWARQRALAYAYTGDPVGDWYDSTAGERYAFCMRDVSHQSVGAAVLGLAGHTRNMLRRFAAGVSATRDWASFWEINKDGFPAPIDYKDDQDFWFCLPANFDVMQACYRQFQWTGDRTYFDAVFSNFYDRTVTAYVEAWDKDKDGIMESRPEAQRRGIPSYHQDFPRPLIGSDLIAAQYKGYLAYASIQESKGVPGSLSQQLAQEFRAKAQLLRTRYNMEWWDAEQARYYSLMMPDHTFYKGSVISADILPLLFGITEEGRKTEAALNDLERTPSTTPLGSTVPRDPSGPAARFGTFSHFPEILFQYGRNDAAYKVLKEITDPAFLNRGKPEIVFAVVGAVASGMMGVSPDAPHQTLETLPRLPKEVQWVKLAHVPVLRNEITVQHRGVTETAVTNEAGPVFLWKVSFPDPSSGRNSRILVDGVPVPTTSGEQLNHQAIVQALVPMKTGGTRIARSVVDNRMP